MREKHACSQPPRKLEPADTTANKRGDGPTVQLCGDNEAVGKWINGKNSLEQKSNIKKHWDDSENLAPMMEKEDRPTLSR